MTTKSCIENLRRASFAAFLALALSACGGNDDIATGPVAGSDTGTITNPAPSSPDPAAPAPVPAVSTTVLAAASIDADIQNLLALTAADRERQARTSSAQVERELLTISGVEAELGGAAATDAAYSGVAAQFVADATSTSASIVKLGLSQARRIQVSKVAVEESAGSALFAGYMEVAVFTNKLAADGLFDLSGELKPGQSKAFEAGEIKGEISLERLAVNSTHTHTANGLDAALNTHFDLVACPDANGVFTGKATFEASMTKSGGATGEKSKLDVSITGHVNDNAETVYYDIDTRMETAEFTNRKGAYVDFNMNYSVGKSPRASSAKVNRTGGQVTEAFANNAYGMGRVMSLILAIQMAYSAEKAWQSGRCVALDPTTNPAQRTGLQPSTAVAITAAPRSKIDGGPVGGSVTGTLSGDGALAPSGTKVPADASFTYTAPDTAGKAGKVSLEARSKRGVAKADLNFDTANDSWIGTASFSDGKASSTAEITWLFVSSTNNVSMYKATGTGTIAYDDGECSYPKTATVLGDGAGILFVDFSTTPPTYHGAALAGFATVTETCKYKVDGSVVTTVKPVGEAVFAGTKGAQGVEAAGSVVVTTDAPMKFEGTDTSIAGGTFRWSFTRGR
jgi:hypothetical protein